MPLATMLDGPLKGKTYRVDEDRRFPIFPLKLLIAFVHHIPEPVEEPWRIVERDATATVKEAVYILDQCTVDKRTGLYRFLGLS